MHARTSKRYSTFTGPASMRRMFKPESGNMPNICSLRKNMKWNNKCFIVQKKTSQFQYREREMNLHNCIRSDLLPLAGMEVFVQARDLLFPFQGCSLNEPWRQEETNWCAAWNLYALAWIMQTLEALCNRCMRTCNLPNSYVTLGSCFKKTFKRVPLVKQYQTSSAHHLREM